MNDETLRLDILAFPQHAETGNAEDWRHGMTLRDAFAKDAPITLSDAIDMWCALNKPKANESDSPSYSDVYELLADMRYSYADAMLAERVK